MIIMIGFYFLYYLFNGRVEKRRIGVRSQAPRHDASTPLPNTELPGRCLLERRRDRNNSQGSQKGRR